MSKTSKKKQSQVVKKKKNIALGVAHIYASFNNTIVTFTDIQGNVIASSSAGANNFSGVKKSTLYAAQVTAAKAADVADFHGIKTLSDIILKGAGVQRDAAVRTLFSRFVMMKIKDVTPVPFNGTKSPKRRRV